MLAAEMAEAEVHRTVFVDLQENSVEAQLA